MIFQKMHFDIIIRVDLLLTVKLMKIVRQSTFPCQVSFPVIEDVIIVCGIKDFIDLTVRKACLSGLSKETDKACVYRL